MLDPHTLHSTNKGDKGLLEGVSLTVGHIHDVVNSLRASLILTDSGELHLSQLQLNLTLTLSQLNLDMSQLNPNLS